MTGTCRNCKHLVRFKKVNDPFWHYKCLKYPNSETFDTWESLTYGRESSECGYEKKKVQDKITPWENKTDEGKYPFKNRWWKSVK